MKSLHLNKRKTDKINIIAAEIFLHRRHLNESQRAMVANKIANIRHGGDRVSEQVANLQLATQAEAAKLLNVSPRIVADAKSVQQNAIPDLTEKVTQGNVAVSTAALVAKLPKEEQNFLEV